MKNLTSPVKTAALSFAMAALMFTCAVTVQAAPSKNIVAVGDTTKKAKMKMMEKEKMKMDKMKMDKMKKDKMKMKKDTSKMKM